MGIRDEYISSLKLAFVRINTRALMTALVLKFPFFLSYPWLQKLIEEQVSDLMAKAAETIEISAFFKYIDVRTNGQGVSFAEAAVQNWVTQNSTTATKEEKQKSEDELFAKFKPFAKFTS